MSEKVSDVTNLTKLRNVVLLHRGKSGQKKANFIVLGFCIAFVL